MVDNTHNSGIKVEVSLVPLPFGARLRANSQIVLAWLRRSVFSLR